MLNLGTRPALQSLRQLSRRLVTANRARQGNPSSCLLRFQDPPPGGKRPAGVANTNRQLVLLSEYFGVEELPSLGLETQGGTPGCWVTSVGETSEEGEHQRPRLRRQSGARRHRSRRDGWHREPPSRGSVRSPMSHAS